MTTLRPVSEAVPKGEKMGKESRNRKREQGASRSKDAKRQVRSFMSTAGVAWPTTNQQLWDNISNGVGAEYATELSDLLDEVDEQATATALPRAYRMLAQSATSARLTLPILAPQTREWLTRFASFDLPSGDVLDLGCGSGFNSCFYAYSRPSSSVVAVDGCKASIEQATKLADDLGLTNIRFLHADIVDLNLGRKFPLVCSTMTHQEVDDGESGTNTFSSIGAGSALFRDARSELAETARRHVDEEGAFVTLERLPNFEHFAGWVGALQAVGFSVSPSTIEEFTWNGPSGSESTPLIISSVEGTQCKFDDVLQVLQAGKFPEASVELDLADTRPLQFVAGHHFDIEDCCGPGMTRVYLLRAGEQVVSYMTTNRGHRDIMERAHSDRLPELMTNFSGVVADLTAAPDVVDERRLSAADLAADFPTAEIASCVF